MDAIKKNQLKVKKKDDKTKGKVDLSERLDRLIKLYPRFFWWYKLKSTRGTCNKWEKNDSKSLSYQILFYDEDNVRSHEINFLEKYGMLYDFLEYLATSKINIDDANADQMSFVINFPPGNETSWRRRNDVSLYVPATSQLRLKWNTQQRLSGLSPRRLSGTSSRHLIGMLWWRLKGT